MSDILKERVEDEIEALKAILMDEVDVKIDESGIPTGVDIAVFPSTADDHTTQYVRVTLLVSLPPGYPDISPKVELKNPRGLDDSVLHLIEKEIKTKIDNSVGEPVIFELIEVVREHLTEKNVPSCQCVICLYGFCERDNFIKTQCYHYFHSHCLASHIINSERIFKEEQEKLPQWQRTNTFKSQCPVCREVISVDMNVLSQAKPSVERENAPNFELNEDLKLLQRKMATLFQHQQSRGGIIDLEAEESKLLLVTGSADNGDNVSSAGPSITPPTEQPNRERRNISRGGRGNRGAFAAARKNRGSYSFTSR